MIKNVLALLCFLFSLNAQSTVWRVNNVAALNADFTQASAAVNSASVMNGDTLYIEPSASVYSNITLNKQLTLIGNGYFLDSANNPGLQENTNNSVVSFITLNAGSEGSHIIGMNVSTVSFTGIGTVANITIEKCILSNASPLQASFSKAVTNVTIKKCFFSSTGSTNVFDASSNNLTNVSVDNCIFEGIIDMNPSPASTNLVVRNCVADRIIATGVYVANSIFISAVQSSFTTCIVRNNIFVSAQAGVTVGPISGPGNANNGNNLVSQTTANVLLTTGSTDGRFQLVPGTSPAIGGGVDIGGVKPDCGAFGGNDPYVLSGIPNIPTIYQYSFPNGDAVPAGTTNIQVDFSTRSNN